MAAEVCVGSLVDQVLNEFVAALLRRAMQRGDADGVGVIDVRSSLDELFHDRQAIDAGSVEDCRSAAIVAGVDVTFGLIED